MLVFYIFSNIYFNKYLFFKLKNFVRDDSLTFLIFLYRFFKMYKKSELTKGSIYQQ